MTRALLLKELREHGFVLLVALVLSATSMMGMLIIARDDGGRFIAFVRFAYSVAVFNALVVANRLFVREYASQTQLFLETLPISRARVFTTKWLLGFAWVLSLVAAAWLATLVFQRRIEVISLAAALGTLASACAFVTVAWAIAAVAGMLGRHRYTVLITLVLAYAYGIASGVSPQDVPVLRLLGDGVAMATTMPAPMDLIVAFAIAAALLAAASALALIGSGAIAAQLARRMTARERSFTAVVILGTIFGLATFVDDREKPSFSVVDAAYVSGRYAHVGVMNAVDIDSERTQSLAQIVVADLDALHDLIPLNGVHVIFVMPQQGMDQFLIQRARLTESEGIVLRTSPQVLPFELRSRVIHDVLSDATKGRASKEDRHVLLDGFAAYWASRDDAEQRERLWLRAAASRLRTTRSLLSRWEQSSEQLGGCIASAQAFSVVDTLATLIGPRRLQAFATRLFATPPTDVRVLGLPSPAQLVQQAGTSWNQLVESAEARRLTARQQHAGELAHVHRRHAHVEVKHTQARGSSMIVHVSGATPYWVSYAWLGPWTRQLVTLARLDVPTSPRPRTSVTLPVSPTHGTRMLVEVDANEPVLGCPVRQLAQRVVAP